MRGYSRVQAKLQRGLIEPNGSGKNAADASGCLSFTTLLEGLARDVSADAEAGSRPDNASQTPDELIARITCLRVRSAAIVDVPAFGRIMLLLKG